MWLYLLSLVIASLLVVLFRINYGYWKRRNIIDAGEVLWEFLFKSRAIPVVYKEIYEKHKDKPHVGVFLGTRPALLLRDLENIQKVLAGEFQSFHSRAIVNGNANDKLADNIVFMDEYDRWKIIRQKISPVFTGAKLKSMFYIMDKCARDFVEMIKINPLCVKKPYDAVYTYATSSLGASIIGIDTHTKNTMDSPFLEMSRKLGNPSIKFALKFAMVNLFPSISLHLNLKIFGEHEDFFLGVIKNVLESRRQSQEKRHDFIDTSLELQKQGVMKDTTTGYELEPTDELLAAQAFFFFLAGTETSSNTMHFTLIELANNPKVLEKIHKEIDKIFDSVNDELSYNNLEKLQYLDMVVNEALRKYPPVGMLQRSCTKATTLPVGNVKVEKDCLVIVPVFGLHRDEKYFPKPDLFDPERFSTENASKIPKFAYLPFSEGNRSCLGMRYARLQVKVGLAWLLRRYTLLPQKTVIDTFNASAFGLRASEIRYEMVPRIL